MNRFNCCNKKTNECRTTTNQCVEVNTPVILETTVDIAEVSVICNEPQIVCSHKKHCNNKYICEFVIKQVLNVEIPVSYQTEVTADNSTINCRNINYNTDDWY